MNDLDIKMQKIAVENWAFFIAVLGKEALISGKARLLRQEGKSYHQIATRLDISVSQVRYACKTKG